MTRGVRQVFSRVTRIAGQRTCGKYKRRVIITSVLGMEARQGSDSLDFFLDFWGARLNGRVPRKDLIAKNVAARDNARARPTRLKFITKTVGTPQNLTHYFFRKKFFVMFSV